MAASSSSSCNPCGYCTWVFVGPPDFEWYLIGECALPDCLCDQPPGHGEDGEVRTTECRPLSIWTRSAAPTPPPLLIANQQVILHYRVAAVLPHVLVANDPNPSAFSTVGLTIPTGGSKRLYAPKWGWIIVYKHITQTREETKVTPPCLPAEGIVSSRDRAFTVGVILPENGILKQYWVTVLDSHPWTTLSTPNWEVLVLRAGK